MAAATATKPRGSVYIRDILEGLGEKVNWDPTGRSISTESGRFKFGPGQYQIDPSTGRSYMDAGSLGLLMGQVGQKEAQQAQQLSPEKFQGYYDQISNIFKPFMSAQSNRSNELANALEMRINGAVGKAEGAYNKGMSDLQERKAGSLDTMRAQLRGSNMSDSPAANARLEALEKGYDDSATALAENLNNNVAVLKGQGLEAMNSIQSGIDSNNASLAGKMMDLAMGMFDRSAQAAASNPYLMTAEYLLGENDKDLENEKFERQILESDRDFEYQQKRDKVSDALAYKKLAADSSGSDLPGTAEERGNQATAELMLLGKDLYTRNAQFSDGNMKGQKKQPLKKGEKNYATGQHPLYFALNTMLKNPEYNSSAQASGADMKAVIDSMIASNANMSPDQYFSTGMGKNLGPIYYNLFPKKKSESEDDGTFNIGGQKLRLNPKTGQMEPVN